MWGSSMRMGPSAQSRLSFRRSFFVVLLLGLVTAGVGMCGLVISRAIADAAVKPADSPPAAGEEKADDSASSPKDSGSIASPALLSPPREVLRVLEQAHSLIVAERYSEAIQRLQGVLLAPDDYFLPTAGEQTATRSLKSEAERLLLELPESAKRLFLLRYEPQAQALLEEAVARGDVSRLLDVWTNYPLTEAGVRAGYLAAIWFLQHAQIDEAARILERLILRADRQVPWQVSAWLLLAGCYVAQGKPEKAELLLRELRAKWPGHQLQVGQSAIRWFSDEESPVDWLRRYFAGLLPPDSASGRVGVRQLIPGVTSRHDVDSGTQAPLLFTVWGARLADYPEFEELLRTAENYERAVGRPRIPATRPLLVGDVVICRSLRNVVAFHAHTGKRLWETPAETFWENFLTSSAGVNPDTLPVLEYTLRMRTWQDATAGSFSSDGTRVYVLERLGLPSAAIDAGMMIVPRVVSRAQRTPENNILAAYDLGSGRRLWQFPDSSTAGGNVGEQVFFLGAPLPVAGSLFVLAYCEGEVRLCELEATTGKLRWQLPLAAVEEPISENWLLRTAGLSPGYHAGIVVCPTGAGSLVAVDVLARRLLWGLSYRETGSTGRMGRLRFLHPALRGGPDGGEFPLGNTVIIAEGCVVTAPSDGEHILCVELTTGRVLKRIARADTVYLAGVYRGQVILVESRAIRLVRVRSDGVAAGRQVRGEEAATTVHTSRGSDEARGISVAANSFAQADLSADAQLLFVNTTTYCHDEATPQEVDDLDTPRLRQDRDKPKGQIGVWGVAVAQPQVAQVNARGGETELRESPARDENPFGQAAAGGAERRLPFPSDGVVAGVGYRNGSTYFVPLTSGEILEIDLDQLAVIRTHRPVREVILGNLVACGGRVVSQSACRVELFYDAELLRAEVAARQARNPSDPQAVFLQTQLLLHEGKYLEALARLEELWRRSPTREVRQWLQEAYLATLRTDFESLSRRLPEFEGIFEDPSDKAQLLQLVALGLEGQQEWHGAWQAYRQLIELDWENPGGLKPEPTWQIRASLWLQQRVKHLWARVPEELRTEIREFASKLLPRDVGRAAGGTSPAGAAALAAREKWLGYFYYLPEGQEVALQHAQELAAAGSLLAAEYWWNRLRAEAAPTVARQATAALARLYIEHERLCALAQLVNELSADTTSGSEAEKSLPQEVLEHPQVQRWLVRPPDWPAGVKVRQESQQRIASARPRHAISSVVPRTGQRGVNTQVFLYSGRPTLAGFNSWGIREWEFPLNEQMEISSFTFFRGVSVALNLGHLAVVKGQQQALALNTLSVGPQGRATMVWGFDLPTMEPMARGGKPSAASREPGAEALAAARANLWMISTGTYEELNSQLILVAGKWIGLQYRNQLAVVDPTSGEKLWVRRDFPPGAAVDADAEFVYIFSRERPEVIILEGESGRLVGKHSVPGGVVWDAAEGDLGSTYRMYTQPVIVNGRLLCREPIPTGGQTPLFRLYLWDIHQSKRVWESPPLPAEAAFTVASREFLAIWQPDDQLRIYRLSDGSLLAEGALPCGPVQNARLTIRLFVNNWQILVVGIKSWSNAPRFSQQVIAGVEAWEIPYGALWAIDHQGRPMWSKPVTLRDHTLPRDLPADIPILVLPRMGSGGQSGPEVTLVLLDRRTGTQVAELRPRSPGPFMEVEADPRQQAVLIKFQRSTYFVNFVDPSEVEGSQQQDASGSAGPSLIDLLRRAIGK